MIGLVEAGRVGAARAEVARFQEDVLLGLSAPRKALPPKWLYDARGSALYELICEQPEYYPTRTEVGILDRHLDQIAHEIGPGALVFEYGTGSGRKTAMLLEALRRPAAYLPVDISPSALGEAAKGLARRFPGLAVRPVVADFTDGVTLPGVDVAWSRRLAFFPGSTIGNFDPPEAVAILRQLAQEAGPGGALLIGVDLPKGEETLVRAYDDARGVTAAFDLNLLARMNRELDADFRLSGFRHRSIWDERLSRVEMHLESREAQLVHVAGAPFTFEEGETIHTESAYKWAPRAFDTLAAIAGWRLVRDWTDDRAWFSVRLYERGG